MFTYPFLVVFKVPNIGATGNLMMAFTTDVPDVKLPKLGTIRMWEKILREEHGYDSVVITNFLPLAD
jgi:hypothetical protein